MDEKIKLTRKHLTSLIFEEINFIAEKDEESWASELLKMRKAKEEKGESKPEDKGEEEKPEEEKPEEEKGEKEGEDEDEMDLEFEADPEEKPEEKAEEKPPEEEKKPTRSLKKLKQGDVNVALNQLRQKGISAESFRKSVVAAVKKIYKAAGPQRKNFAQKDTPTIKMISNEVMKILKGDFSNLVNESRKPFFMVHPVTYAVIKLLGESKQSIQISIRRNKK